MSAPGNQQKAYLAGIKPLFVSAAELNAMHGLISLILIVK
jgi:hypothetical protein